MEHRKGNQMAPADFTKHIEKAHDHHDYPAMTTWQFQLPIYFTKKVEQAIRKGKNQNAVGADGLHVEMFKAEPIACTSVLTVWWKTVGRISEFADNWKEGILCPLYKKGAQDDPTNIRPVGLLSHARKTADAVI